MSVKHLRHSRWSWTVGLFLVGASGSSAQRVTPTVFHGLAPGAVLRVETGSTRVVGPLLRVGVDTLYLESGALALRTIDDAWVRKRATLRGMKIGGLIGAPAGALTFGVGFVFFNSLCEYECDDITAENVARASVGGAALGALLGAGAGTIIGASTSYWSRLSGPSAGVGVVKAGAQARRGAAAVTPALAVPIDADGTGIGMRASYLYLTRNFSIGPELGYYTLGERERGLPFDCGTPAGDPVCTDTYQASEHVTHGSALARVGTGRDRVVEGYATGSMGAYLWGTDARDLPRTAGYSIGAGAELRSRNGWRGLFVEGRWHSNIGAVDGDFRYGFYTLGVGGTLAW